VPRGAGMKVAIVGNCQGEGIALCASTMAPQAKFHFTDVSTLSDVAEGLDELAQASDLLFAQNMLRSVLPASAAGKTLLFPMIAFPAYHPDQCYVRGRRLESGELAMVTNDMVMYHSTIAVAGYKAGLSVDDAVRLFSADTFQKLGFFDVWDVAMRDLLAEGLASGVPLSAMVNRWVRSGCFMHSINHPTLRVHQDLGENLLLRAGINIEQFNVARYLEDPFRHMSIWPVYPGIAERHGMRGDYGFVRGMLRGAMTLPQFVEHSFARYSEYDRASLEAIGGTGKDAVSWIALKSGGVEPDSTRIPGNPYRHIDERQFWKNSVASIAPDDLDPVFTPRIGILPTERVATAGSCFAQHIARTLSTSGFNYFVPESAPPEMPTQEALASNYGVFSARYGNIYTVRQLVQLFKRAIGAFLPQEELWLNRSGRVVDPFRPQIEPDGFADTAAMMSARTEHLEAVERMMRETDVLVFTLGLTEGWRSKLDGSIYPLAPGVAGGEMDTDRYEFVNFTVDEVVADLHEALDLLSWINPACRVILTVSPVPLIATYEPRHALVATTYSKSVLRTAADMICRQHGHVDYFPSYEIITGSFNHGAYFEEDLRTVRGDGVAHVMRIFMKHFADSGSNTKPRPSGLPASAAPAGLAEPRSALFEIVCDEEAIVKL
jgi:hypothetical protein